LLKEVKEGKTAFFNFGAVSHLYIKNKEIKIGKEEVNYD